MSRVRSAGTETGYSHTPGPWLQSSTVLVCNEEARVIANCTPMVDIPELAIPMRQVDANARLIAAAPRMLAALELAYAKLDDKAAKEEIGALLTEVGA